MNEEWTLDPGWIPGAGIAFVLAGVGLVWWSIHLYRSTKKAWLQDINVALAQLTRALVVRLERQYARYKRVVDDYESGFDPVLSGFDLRKYKGGNKKLQRVAKARARGQRDIGRILFVTRAFPFLAFPFPLSALSGTLGFAVEPFGPWFVWSLVVCAVDTTFLVSVLCAYWVLHSRLQNAEDVADTIEEESAQ